MTPKIHLFNPGHETAILQGTVNYTPPTNVQRMIKELAYLPIWYADSDDYVFTEEIISPRFISLLPKELRPFATILSTQEIKTKNKMLPNMEASPWGLSPQSCHFFEKMQKGYNLPISVPTWKEEYKQLTSRETAASCLALIQELLPEIALPVPPKFCKEVKEVEKYLILQSAPFILKTPFSSSGRGIHWLMEGKLTAKDRTWIEGAIKKQGCISIEPALDKYQDFALEFFSNGKGDMIYQGLSVFGSEKRGAYSGNVLGSQQYLERFFIENFGSTFQIIKEAVQEALKQLYASVYTGYIGVDMLVYRDKRNGNLAIHPCIEINMRYTMGMVALRISEKYLSPHVRGDMHISYESKDGEAYAHHSFMKKAYPLKIENGRITEGYLSLCPVTKETRYRAYILIF
ncbi:MAG: hypothetical protein Q4A54_06890 [Parabacteroides sp.]|nr:hypothetical protein [Parabacteroides sp.]